MFIEDAVGFDGGGMECRDGLIFSGIQSHQSFLFYKLCLILFLIDMLSYMSSSSCVNPSVPLLVIHLSSHTPNLSTLR